MIRSTSDLRPGQILDDRFEILALVSEGAWSAVFKARDRSTAQVVAVKVPPRHLGGIQYLREAEIGRQLDHPSILRFIPVAECARSRPYLVTEYLEGRSLYEEMQRRGPLPVAETLRLGAAVCDALEYLHGHRIIHCDLKPGNIMLCADGSLRIIDFGVARWTAPGLGPFGGFLAHVGTPEYMAPEQVKGKRGDARTDLYALGAILYEMLTGRQPFDNELERHRWRARVVGDPVAPSRYDSSLPAEIEEIVLHALARRPSDRYASATAMKADLQMPGRVSVTGRAQRLRPPSPARLWLPIAGLVLFSLLVPVALFFVFLMFLRR